MNVICVLDLVFGFMLVFFSPLPSPTNCSADLKVNLKCTYFKVLSFE